MDPNLGPEWGSDRADLILLTGWILPGYLLITGVGIAVVGSIMKRRLPLLAIIAWLGLPPLIWVATTHAIRSPWGYYNAFIEPGLLGFVGGITYFLACSRTRVNRRSTLPLPFLALAVLLAASWVIGSFFPILSENP